MTKLQSLFEAYGADYNAAMARFMGNEVTYLRILNMLFQDTNLQKLGDALSRGDLAGAFEAAHTLKGVAGNLGLTPFYESVCSIVEPLREGAQRDYSQMYQNILSEFKKVEMFRENEKRGDQE